MSISLQFKTQECNVNGSGSGNVHLCDVSRGQNKGTPEIWILHLLFLACIVPHVNFKVKR